MDLPQGTRLISIIARGNGFRAHLEREEPINFCPHVSIVHLLADGGTPAEAVENALAAKIRRVA